MPVARRKAITPITVKDESQQYVSMVYQSKYHGTTSCTDCGKTTLHFLYLLKPDHVEMWNCAECWAKDPNKPKLQEIAIYALEAHGFEFKRGDERDTYSARQQLEPS